ncbi:MAG: mechanosensitive ion channel family protein [Phycisphaerales bacterium]|nr:mechanosensitive ion channel family protein [Phycisphaerales bacterium]
MNSTPTEAGSPLLLDDSAASEAVAKAFDQLQAWTASWEIGTFWSETIAVLIAVVVVGGVCWIANCIAKWGIKTIALRPLRKSKTRWAQAIIDQKVLERLSHLVPVVLLAVALPAFAAYGVDTWLRPAIEIYAIFVLLLTAFGLLEVGEEVIAQLGLDDKVPAQGISQALKLVLTFVAIVLMMSVLFDKSPWWFLSGVGAIAAVLMLVFKDSILGLVAGIQVSANDMVRVGDWITIPSKGVDGDVEEISLTTIKIRAFDKTVSLVPAHDLVTSPFTNWRGMSESGGRRIKRSITIDLATIRFVGRDDLQRYQKFTLLKDELDRRIADVDAWNTEHQVDTTEQINGRQQTNVGVFRAYIEAYLRQHPKIHTEGFTFLVRHLQPGPDGLPIELYVFSNDNRWVPYEGIQADIFDHLLASVPEFDLAVFQSPSGRDVAALKST